LDVAVACFASLLGENRGSRATAPQGSHF